MSVKTGVPFEAIQTAVYTLLYGNITGGFYDEVPPGAVHPYTTIDFLPDKEFEARGVKGRMVLLALKTFSKDAGGKFECYTIMNEIVELMTASPLSMTGWREVWKTYRSGVPERYGEVERLAKGSAIHYQGTTTFLICVCKE